MSEVNCGKYKIKIGEQEIFLSPEVLEIIHEYFHRPMGLEELARKLNLESWEQAYEFIKKVPAWIAWTPVSIWRERLLKENCLEEA